MRHDRQSARETKPPTYELREREKSRRRRRLAENRRHRSR